MVLFEFEEKRCFKVIARDVVECVRCIIAKHVYLVRRYKIVCLRPNHYFDQLLFKVYRQIYSRNSLKKKFSCKSLKLQRIPPKKCTTRYITGYSDLKFFVLPKTNIFHCFKIVVFHNLLFLFRLNL